MDLDIRRNIYKNLKDDTEINIIRTIDESLDQEDELALPGLGVLMEMSWRNMTNSEKNGMASKIKKELHKIYL